MSPRRSDAQPPCNDDPGSTQPRGSRQYGPRSRRGPHRGSRLPKMRARAAQENGRDLLAETASGSVSASLLLLEPLSAAGRPERVPFRSARVSYAQGCVETTLAGSLWKLMRTGLGRCQPRNQENPLDQGLWQSRPDSNWRFRLERPASWASGRRDLVSCEDYARVRVTPTSDGPALFAPGCARVRGPRSTRTTVG